MEQSLRSVSHLAQTTGSGTLSRLAKSSTGVALPNGTRSSTYSLFAFLDTVRQSLLDLVCEDLRNLEDKVSDPLASQGWKVTACSLFHSWTASPYCGGVRTTLRMTGRSIRPTFRCTCPYGPSI